jgi:hypothetical protein
MGLATTLHERDFAAGIPIAYTAVRGIALATAAIPVLVVMAWRRDNWSRATRVHYSTVVWLRCCGFPISLIGTYSVSDPDFAEVIAAIHGITYRELTKSALRGRPAVSRGHGRLSGSNTPEFTPRQRISDNITAGNGLPETADELAAGRGLFPVTSDTVDHLATGEGPSNCWPRTRRRRTFLNLRKPPTTLWTCSTLGTA